MDGESLEDNVKQMLSNVSNELAKIEVKEKVKSSYYLFFNNTMILSAAQLKKNNCYENILLLSHECVHSIQKRLLHVLNFILANIEIILFIVCIVMNFITGQIGFDIKILYITVCILSILIRYYMEIQAVIKGVVLADQNIREKETAGKIIEWKQKLRKYKCKQLITFPLFILYLFGIKIIRLMIIIYLPK